VTQPAAVALSGPTEADRLRGVALVVASALVWSTGGLIVRSLTLADSWTTIFWRSVAATVFLVGLTFAEHGRRAPSMIFGAGWPGIAVGGCFAGSSIALIVALNLTSVVNVLVIMSSAPLFAALLGWALMGERVRPWTWAAIVASMAGIGLMVAGPQGRGSLAGDLIALGMAIGYGAATALTRKYRAVRMTPAMCLATAAGALIALPLSHPWQVSATDVPLLALFGAGQLGFGMALFAVGGRLVPAAATALLGTLEPILGPVWVWLLIGEVPAPMALAGGLVVLAALAAHTLIDTWMERRG
jgi:drug/metabolite transporter (DMT)-like permease